MDVFGTRCEPSAVQANNERARAKPLPRLQLRCFIKPESSVIQAAAEAHLSSDLYG
jgi:hypothetical protein